MYSKASVNFYFYEENENKVYDRNNVKYSSGIMWDANYTTRTYGISKKSITKPGRHYFIIYYKEVLSKHRLPASKRPLKLLTRHSA